MLGVTSCKKEERKVESYQPYKPFAIVVEETTWDGYREGTKIVRK